MKENKINEKYNELIKDINMQPYLEVMKNLELDKSKLIDFMIINDYDINDNNDWIMSIKYIILDDIFNAILNNLGYEDRFDPTISELKHITNLSNNIKIYLQSGNEDLNKILKISNIFNLKYKYRNEIEQRVYDAIIQNTKSTNEEIDDDKRYKRAVERYNELQKNPIIQPYLKTMIMIGYPNIDNDLIGVVVENPRYDIENDDDWLLAIKSLALYELFYGVSAEETYDKFTDKQISYIYDLPYHTEEYLRNDDPILKNIIELSDPFNPKYKSWRDIEKPVYDAICTVVKKYKMYITNM